MMFRNQLGSVSALSLAATSSVALPVLATVAGVGITVAAAYFSYKIYDDYQEKKHKEDIDRVNALHKAHLEKIYIPDYHDLQGFPAIFKLTKNENTTSVESMHFTLEEINEIGEHLPRGLGISLSTYREAIINVIKKLKAYYKERGIENDVTAGVLSYLLYIFESKCLKFEGYDYDIAYLGALSNFINAYASPHKREVSQHFSRLGEVYRHVQDAKQALEKHKEALSLEEILSELRDESIDKSSRFIKNFAKIVNKSEDWEYVDTVTMSEIADGLLRREYIRSEIKGIVMRFDPAKPMPDSIFKKWLLSLASYYLKTLDPDSDLKSDDIVSPGLMFSYPDLLALQHQSKEDNSLASDSSKISSRDEQHNLKSMRQFFQQCSNFITTIVDGENKNTLPRLVPVTDSKEMMTRVQLLANYATLTHKIISLQFLCTFLLKSVKQLGEIYVKNPHHFCHVFKVLDHLCNQIKDDIEVNKKSIIAIHVTNKNTMQLEKKGLFSEEMKSSLDVTHAIITRLGQRVKEYRERVFKNLNIHEPTKYSVKHEMFEVSHLYDTLYQMHSSVANKKVLKPRKALPTPPRALLVPVKNPAVSSEAIRQDHEDSPQDKLLHIKNLLKDIEIKITSIKNNEQPDSKDIYGMHLFTSSLTCYKDIFKQLTDLRKKDKLILQDEKLSIEQHQKTIVSLDLCLLIAARFRDYLALNKTDRLKNVGQLSTDIHAEIIDQRYVMLDLHANKFNKAVYSVFQLGIFCTNTRNRYTTLDQTLKTFVKASELLASSAQNCRDGLLMTSASSLQV